MEPCTRDAILGSMWKPTPCPPSRYTLTEFGTKQTAGVEGLANIFLFSKSCICLHIHF